MTRNKKKNDNENTTHENKRKEMQQSIIQHGETLNEFWKQKRMKIISNDDNCNNSEGKTMALPLSLLLSLSQSKDIVNALGTNVTFFTHSDQRNKAKEEESNNNKEEEEVKYVETFQSSNSTPKLHAMDCEMVKTTKGIEVARVTLLRYKQDAATHNKEDYDVLLDTLIKPQNPILDYLTDYSGMTPQLLENVTTNLSQIQCLLLSLICKDDVIIGHSLENDLRCLRLIHGCVVDTSVIFRGRNGRKYSLRHLSSVLLKRKIQINHPSNGTTTVSNKQDQQKGHCSEEDAAAALTLALRRCRIGPSFHMKEQLNRTNLLELICSTRRRYMHSSSTSWLFPVVTTNDVTKEGPLVCIGPQEWISKHVTSSNNNAHALSCENIKDEIMVKGIYSWLKQDKNKKNGGEVGRRKASLLWANLEVDVGEEENKGYKRIDKVVFDLISQVPASTTIFILFQNDYKKAITLTQRRKTCKDPRSTLGWTDCQEKEWTETVDRCRYCEAFWVGMSS